MPDSIDILVVDDDTGHLAMLSTLLGSWGYTAHRAESGEQALEMIASRGFDLVLMDIRMPGMGGIAALTRIREYNPALPVLIMTAYSSIESAIQALKNGAYDYLLKPLDMDGLRMTLERAMEHHRLKHENQALKERLAHERSPRIIGKSPAMHSLLETIATVAPTGATVLITGESGTGKELIAKALHYNSDRAEAQLVTVNCAALSENLLESELFGHEKGAFTGADRRRDGRFMQAHKGTLFLDEIAEISPAMQAKLLRALQEGEIQRVGGDLPLTVDVRIIAATNRDLKREVESGDFREDLYYRLKVVTLHSPPLRERSEDIPLLARHFMEIYAPAYGKDISGFTPKAMDAMLRHTWPGNVRELENVVERAVIMAPSGHIDLADLPRDLLASDEPQEMDSPMESPATSGLAGLSLEEVERKAILETLEECDGNKSEAARRLGITRATLHKKLHKYGYGEDG